MIHFLKLVRWKNLLLIALVQLLIKYALFPSFQATTALNDFQFTLLLLATLFIAVAGNIINDIYDVETDLVNKPNRIIVDKHISEKAAFNLFIIFNIIGVGLGFYLANDINRSGFATLFVITSALLYVYSTYLKYLILIGNIVISILIVLSILIVGFFDLIPNLSPSNKDVHIGIFQILLVYSAFAFVLNLIREVVKDIEDINGDYKAEMKTLPIVIGRERTTIIAFALSLLPIFGIIYIIVDSLYKYELVMAYLLLFVVAPTIYTSIKLYAAEKEKDYYHISQLLKLIMLSGVLSLLMYPLVINNA
jgi:4-hydroxybenzoate polyprenyltransferase